MKTKKDLLETRAAKQLRQYADQITELERLHHAALDEMLREDKTCQVSAVALLESAIGRDSQHALGIYYGHDDKVFAGAVVAESSSDAEEELDEDLERNDPAIDQGAS